MIMELFGNYYKEVEDICACWWSNDKQHCAAIV